MARIAEELELIQPEAVKVSAKESIERNAERAKSRLFVLIFYRDA